MPNNYDIFVQSIAIISLVIFALSYQSRTRKRILLINIVGIIVLIAHYLLLKAWTGAVINILNAIFAICFVLREKYEWLNTRILLYCALMILVLGTIYSWEAFYSIFALLGVLLMTISRWQGDTQKLRLIAVLASLAWITYDYFAGSIGGIVLECFILLSLFISIFRNKQSSKN